MQGYGTMAREAADQFEAQTLAAAPTHVFVQAGVGSLAGAVQGYFAKTAIPQNPPVVTVMEAEAADCLYRGAVAGDGSMRVVDGDLEHHHGRAGVRRAQYAQLGHPSQPHGFFRELPGLGKPQKACACWGAPVKGDPQVVSGESGAVGMGLISAIMQRPSLCGAEGRRWG